MSITLNAARIGNFTSSQIFELIKEGKGNAFSAPGLRYITEKNLERKLGRSIDTEISPRPALWGSFLEQRVYNLLPFGYEYVSQQTGSHPTIECWSGSADLIVPGVKIAEIKCYYPQKFAQYTDALMSNDIQLLKDLFPQEYWQMVSNAIINQVSKAEAITYMPYEKELPIIKEMADSYDGLDYHKYLWIADGEDCTLPYLPNDSYYKNLNLFEFEVPQEDIELLTNRVLLAETMLIRIK